MRLTHPPDGSIVVGVDGSGSCDEALEWAVGQAALESRPLTLVHALDLLGPGQAALTGPSLIGPPELVDARTEAGGGILEAASRRVRRLAPRLDLFEVLSQADPRNAILAEASRARMVVMGSRGRGPVASPLLGSVSIAVTRHADCPVVITRPHGLAQGREGVLIGVARASSDRAVVELGFELASRRAMPLTVVHCFWDASQVGRAHRRVEDHETGLDDKRLLLRDAVASVTGEFPDVHPRLELVRGFADQQLVERSRTMDVLLVGHRRPTLSAPGFSSIAPTVVEHAHCTMVVVPLSG